MKKTLIILFIFTLIIVIYNNSSMHVTKHMWKLNAIEGGYEDVLIFKIGGKYCHEYRYDWPYIYKNEKKIGYVFCIGDRMWVKKFTEEANIVEYVGK